MEMVQTWKEHHQDYKIMQKKVDLIGRKLILKFYTPPSPVSGGVETRTKSGKRMDAEGAAQWMCIEGYDEGEEERRKVPE